MIDPEKIAETSELSPPILEAITLNGQKYYDIEHFTEAASGELDARNGGGEESLLIPAGKFDSLEFQFFSPQFSEMSSIHYQYCLQGFDKEWIEAGGQGRAFYSFLKPGDYTFKVKAGNPLGAWGTEKTLETVRYLPHFYQTRFFKILFGSSLGFGIFWAIL